MSELHDSMMTPPIEGLLERAESKFRLVTLGASRAREINAYFGGLGEGLGVSVPPQVTSVSRKPLSIAFEEIAADKIIATIESDDDSGIAVVAGTESAGDPDAG
jgi:DNA-directed RNA polymerase subunit omega